MKAVSAIQFDLFDELRLPEEWDMPDTDNGLAWDDLDQDLSDASDEKTVLD